MRCYHSCPLFSGCEHLQLPDLAGKMVFQSPYNFSHLSGLNGCCRKKIGKKAGQVCHLLLNSLLLIFHSLITLLHFSFSEFLFFRVNNTFYISHNSFKTIFRAIFWFFLDCTEKIRKRVRSSPKTWRRPWTTLPTQFFTNLYYHFLSFPFQERGTPKMFESYLIIRT